MASISTCETSQTDLEELVARQLDQARVGCVLAGFPKCGTTSLAHWINGCPEISVSNPKETFLLCRENRRQGDIAAEGELANCFSDLDASFRVEASTLNVYSQHLLDALATRDKVKVILIYRDPVAAAISWHNQVVQAQQAFSNDLEQSWQHAKDAHENEAGIPLMQNYISICSHGQWIQAWLDRLGHDRVLVLRMDDLSDETSDLAARVNHFFGGNTTLTGIPPALNQYASIRFHGLYRAYKNSALNQSFRALERAVPLAGRVRTFAKEKFFRRKTSKPTGTGLESTLKAYFQQDHELAEHLHGLNIEHWEQGSQR
ncbi:MAG: sulfotransferase domain-containing protein [Planctomycetota bacterium]